MCRIYLEMVNTTVTLGATTITTTTITFSSFCLTSLLCSSYIRLGQVPKKNLWG